MATQPEAKLLILIAALEARDMHDTARTIERSTMLMLMKNRSKPRLIRELLLLHFLKCLRDSAHSAGCTPLIEAFAELDPPVSCHLIPNGGTVH